MFRAKKKKKGRIICLWSVFINVPYPPPVPKPPPPPPLPKASPLPLPLPDDPPPRPVPETTNLQINKYPNLLVMYMKVCANKRYQFRTHVKKCVLYVYVECHIDYPGFQMGAVICFLSHNPHPYFYITHFLTNCTSSHLHAANMSF